MKDFDLNTIEFMAARFNPMLPTGDKFLDSRYDWQATVNGVAWPYYRFFCHLSGMLRPKLIVELGGYQGTAAAHFAKGWSDSLVVTIDHHTDPGDEGNKIKMEEAVDRYSNLMYVQGWTTQNLADSQAGNHMLGDAPSAFPQVLKVERKIDILFIDSWHNYEYAREDWETYKILLNNPALVICDDIQAGGGPENPISGMLQFWNELPEPKFLNSNLHPGTNLGFIKVSTTTPSRLGE